MKLKNILVTGSSGLIGSETVKFFHDRGFFVHGIDNNQRAVFFGPEGDTLSVRKKMSAVFGNYLHHELDIRDRNAVLALLEGIRPAMVAHAAGQPSHELAASIPFDDFDTNASGTLNLLEASRRYCPESPFVYFSTNKVYGDSPNAIALKELPTRWDYDDPLYSEGIPETFPVDRSMHSLFGASKLAGDVMVQEYGRYFNMPTCCLRAGCVAGAAQAGVELHGFLGYLVECNLAGREYKIFGYKGKQVRDNLHARDAAAFIYAFYLNPRQGEVYNLGGGRENSCSILEAFKLCEEAGGKKQVYTYLKKNRKGDHICYYSDLRKIKSHFPGWKVETPLKTIIRELVEARRESG
jgi:CDP-paratose 2-epimerase